MPHRLRPDSRAAHPSSRRVGGAGVPSQAGLGAAVGGGDLRADDRRVTGARERLETMLGPGRGPRRTHADRGATRKALLRLGGEHVIETVLMGYRDRVTVCVSSKAGCAMGCTFCATGQMGLRNNLTAGEIAAQVVWARREAARLPGATPQRLTNVVFMGMGEPMANYRAVDAVARLIDPRACGSARGTSRYRRWASCPASTACDRPPPGRAGGQLHAADDELRDELVPPNRLHPLTTLEAAMAEWRERTKRRPSIEWAMIDGVNDPTSRRAARVHRVPAGRAREPDPAEPHARMAPPEFQVADRGVRAGAQGRGCERHGPRHARTWHRRGVRPTPSGTRVETRVIADDRKTPITRWMERRRVAPAWTRHRSRIGLVVAAPVGTIPPPRP